MLPGREVERVGPVCGRHSRATPGPDLANSRGEARSDQWDHCVLEHSAGMDGQGKGEPAQILGGRCGSWRPSLACPLCPQVYSSMERLSLLEECRVPPPTKRSLSEEKEEPSGGLVGLKGRDRSWVIGSPEV